MLVRLLQFLNETAKVVVTDGPASKGIHARPKRSLCLTPKCAVHGAFALKPNCFIKKLQRGLSKVIGTPYVRPPAQFRFFELYMKFRK